MAHAFLVEDFIKGIPKIPWFKSIKKDFDWDTWPGPENWQVGILNQIQSDWFYHVLNDQEKKQTKEIFRRAEKTVFDSASLNVPYDETEDAYYGPSTCVWQAGWLAGLIVAYKTLQKPLPPGMVVLWNLYEQGHWPWGFASGNEVAEADIVPEKLEIY